jgi:general secretion pathway protein H
MLVVLALVGLMASAIVLTLPKDKSVFERDVQTLTVRLNQLVETSIVDASPKAFGVSEDGYAFFAFNQAQWDVAFDSPWPDGVQVALEVDGLPVKLPSKTEPMIMFEISGLSNSFALNLLDADETFDISSDGQGRISLIRQDL